MTWADGLPDLFYGGHFEFCTGNELLKGFRFIMKQLIHIFLGHATGVGEEPFIPQT